MACKRKGFKAKLNKADLAHFKEMSEHGRVTLRALNDALAHQREKGTVCHACNLIARKLGIEVTA